MPSVQQHPLTLVRPFRGSRRPDWPFGINWHSEQADGLVGWWPYVQPRGAQPRSNNGAEAEVIEMMHGFHGRFLVPTAGVLFAWKPDPDLGWMLLRDSDETEGPDVQVPIAEQPEFNIVGDMTLTAWVRISDQASVDGSIVSRRGDTTNRAWQLRWDASTTNFAMTVTEATDQSGTHRYSTASTVTPDTLYFVVGRFTAGTPALDIFVNGVLDNGTLDSGPLQDYHVSHTLDLTMMGKPDSGGGFRGRVADIRVYRRALPDALIFQMWHPTTRWELYAEPRNHLARFLQAGAAAPPAAEYGLPRCGGTPYGGSFAGTLGKL